MKHVLFAGVALGVLGAAVSAQAADLPNRKQAPAYAPIAAPVQAFSWNGFYIGANTGYATGAFTKGGKGDFGSPSGGLLGLTAGYNYQVGQFVAGIEGDYDWTSMHSKASPALNISGNGRLTSTGTLRGRVGYAADRALIYATGGLAVGNISGKLYDNAVIPAVAYGQHSTHTGYTLGAGIEYAFTNNVSAKAEYRYTSLGNKAYFGGVDATSAGLHSNAVLVGLNYHF